MSGTVVGSGSKNKIKNCSHESYILMMRHGSLPSGKNEKECGIFNTESNKYKEKRKERKGFSLIRVPARPFCHCACKSGIKGKLR